MLALGMVFWLVPAAIGVVVALLFGWVQISFTTAGAGTVLLAMYLPLLVFLFKALPEELAFRDYFYRNLAERYARWIAVVG